MKEDISQCVLNLGRVYPGSQMALLAISIIGEQQDPDSSQLASYKTLQNKVVDLLWSAKRDYFNSLTSSNSTLVSLLIAQT